MNESNVGMEKRVIDLRGKEEDRAKGVKVKEPRVPDLNRILVVRGLGEDKPVEVPITRVEG